ncbi:MAG: hypothetical protein GY879_07185 [Planctomycetes bacterium]|nr:hypothetical protein [Planctomycetota bacterium]MCP4862097.1 hypothetical protein [Planctomycetota bacterium]
MEVIATLIVDLPLDERRFHGLLRDVAAVASVAATEPSSLVSKHYFQPPLSGDRNADCLVSVGAPSSLPKEVLDKLKGCGFRPQSTLRFELARPETDRQDFWDLLRHYANELRGWILTADIDFNQAVSHYGSEEGLMQTSQPNDDNPAVLISASTMKRLAP